ncbi:MAG: Hsp70 family protein, partial [Pseudomonadota bacterium]
MIVGIDLGTTNSLLAVWHDGSPRIVRSATGRDLTPSAVSVAEDGHILVGDAARDRLVSHPERSIGYFKRFMGSDRQLTIAGRQFRPEELSALVIRQLLDDAEADTGARPTDAVISVPAYFSDAQRKATRTAGQLAGLNVERLVNEPTAAAMAYGLHELADERLIVVIDLGGGTLDVSILEFFDGVMEVHATAGDNHLGGRDFDESITTWFTKEIGLSIDELRTAEQARLIAASEAARHRLTDSDAAVLTLAQSRRFRGELVHQAELTRTTFESLCAPLLSRMQIAIERAIRDSKLSLDQITDVILVGGATRMALVRSLVSRMFQRIPLSRPDPDRIVAEGAAVQAALKARDASLKDVVLT